MFAKSFLALFGVLAISNAALADDESHKLINNSYQQSVTVTCTGLEPGLYSGNCSLTFPAMTDAITVVTAVSCSAFVTPGSFAGFRLIKGTALGSPTLFLPAFVYAQGAPGGFLQVATNAAASLFFDKGDTAVIFLDVSNAGNVQANTSLTCTISGYHS